MELTQILQKALEIGGSDIFLIPGSAATAKVTATSCSTATATTIFRSPSTGRRASAATPISSAARWRRPAAS